MVLNKTLVPVTGVCGKCHWYLVLITNSVPLFCFVLQDYLTKSLQIRNWIMQLPVQLQMASPAAKEWLQKRRDNVRPWTLFVNTGKFKAPASVQRWTKRIAKNVDYFQSNYVFVFIVLIIYCLITSPLLLIAIAAALGGCHIISLKNAEKKLVIGGHEVPLVHQYAVMGIISLPVFYWAGAGAVLFWVLGLRQPGNLFTTFDKLRELVHHIPD
ncbi:prenylated Rab acceptor protein 1-like isoform X2 [Oratosquilla oratoria]|uniref:prenylated Rab acceptor protein 1-like isoform X2 n=1 Tax=Oratosquilla oratoria TaxID=337810 RepID=UPI003F7780B1